MKEFDNSNDVHLPRIPTAELVCATIAAELVEGSLRHQEAGVAETNENSSGDSASSIQSWPFRSLAAVQFFVSRCFGIFSIVLLLAIGANVPLVQFLCFGYLLEVTGRIARGGKLSAAMIGLRQASRLGGIIAGTWLLLLPVRLISDKVWYEAYLIDPNSNQTLGLRLLLIVLLVLVIIQILAAWLCGGKLRYFFWQAFAPFSFAVWGGKKLLSTNFLRPLLEATLSWISPNLVADLVATKPVTDWFVPSILWRKFRGGDLYRDARDGLWLFVAKLNLVYYFRLGIIGFAGTLLWLAVPTLLLVSATNLEEGPGVICGLLGSLFAVPVFALLPFVQANFATDGNWKRFLELRPVLKTFRRAPLAHVVALLLTLVLALPLYLLKVETIPRELLWSLSVVFVVFSWPSRIAIGLAVRRGASQQSPGWW